MTDVIVTVLVFLIVIIVVFTVAALQHLRLFAWGTAVEEIQRGRGTGIVPRTGRIVRGTMRDPVYLTSPALAAAPSG